MAGRKAKVENFNISQFVADNAWISTFETIEQAYNAGVSEQEVVLDKIRAEITGIADSDGCGDYLLGFNFGLMRAVQIIDKYRLESEEDEHMTADEFAELFTERDKEQING